MSSAVRPPQPERTPRTTQNELMSAASVKRQAAATGDDDIFSL